MLVIYGTECLWFQTYYRVQFSLALSLKSVKLTVTDEMVIILHSFMIFCGMQYNGDNVLIIFYSFFNDLTIKAIDLNLYGTNPQRRSVHSLKTKPYHCPSSYDTPKLF